MTGENWPEEAIPDVDFVYYRIHKSFLVGGTIRGNCFREQVHSSGATTTRSMSTDWSKYARPDETQARGKRPLDNLVVALPVRSVREIGVLSVSHSPRPDNRSHADVFGVSRDPEIRDRLREIAEIVLSL